jgi:hypothetical protein
MVDLDVHTTDGRRCTVQLLQQTTLAAAAEAARQQLLLVTGQGVGGDAPDAYARAGADCLRLRRFSPASGRGGAAVWLPAGSRFLWTDTRPLTVLSDT